MVRLKDLSYQYKDNTAPTIENISFFIRTDMHAIDKHLTLLNPYKRFLDTAFSHTKGFYLRTM